MVPALGQTVQGFSGDSWIFLAINDIDDVIVRCPVTLKLYTFPRFFFDF